MRQISHQKYTQQNSALFTEDEGHPISVDNTASETRLEVKLPIKVHLPL